MSLLLAVLLGFVQGLTEFIPISSTAHMTILGQLTGLLDRNHPEQWTATMAVVQLGTLCAVVAYFATDLRLITGSLIRETFIARKVPTEQSSLSRLGWLIALGSVPIGIAGIAFRAIIEGSFTKDSIVITVMLVVVAVAMIIAERRIGSRPLESIRSIDALIIGIAQACALIPGASRSGTTISAGMLIGLERAAAARFSFLLSIPALFASGVFELVHALHVLTYAELLHLSIATLSAAVSGYFSIAFLLTFLSSHRLTVFALYRIGFAIVVIVLHAGGLLQ